MDLLDLPTVMIENILSYLSYDEIAKNRVVCKAFNELSMRMLNRGFLMIERRHALALKTVKAQLPRRESERRYHPLARHCDILTSIETRISMLNMTYSKFIEGGMCCFIPGKVIDEIRRVLHIAENMKSPPRAHEVLQELRDISSMAIEHFDDKISPALRARMQRQALPPPPRPHVFSPMAIRQEVSTLRRRSILNAKLSLFLASQYKLFHNKQMMEYQKIALRQRLVIRRMLRRQRRQEANIAELKRRLDECDIRYSELTHTKPVVGPSISEAESPPPAAPLRHFGSQIKLDLSVLPIGSSRRGRNLLPNIRPRKPVIRMPSLSEDDSPAPVTPSTSTDSPRASPKTKGWSSLSEDPLSVTSSNSTDSPRASPKTKVQSTLAKIRGITNEIRHLTNLSRTIEGKLKRPYCTVEDWEEVKKMKLE